jgi:two-component system response regulator MprA
MGSVRTLIVEDDRSVREAIRRALVIEGYEVVLAEDGLDAVAAIDARAPDCVVLGIDGLEVCRRVRQSGNRIPILILTARDAVADRIDGLDAGADDYLVKPFDVGELKARLRALMRRVGVEGDGELSFAELRLDSARHGVVVADDEFVELTRTEFRLLELLMRNPKQVLPHSLIYERVWDYDFGPTSNALRVYVGYLRRKLQEAGSRDLIHTVRGVGYGLREQ